MVQKVLAVMIVVAAAVTTGLLTLLPVAAQEQGPSATRSFDAATVAPGGEVEVTIAVANYGGFGEVTETLPAGFAYVSSPKSDQVEATGQTVSLTLQGDTSIAYTVTASDTAGLHAFSGTLRDSDRNNHDVGGASSVAVAAAPTGPVPSATRSFDAATVAPGGEVEVTIAVANYGGFGEVTETLPAGFAYVSSPKSDQVEATGQTVSLTLQGDTSIAYTVTASDTAGLHAFSGTLRDSDRNNHDVGGASSVTVAAAPTGPVPSATRSFDPATANPGGEVEVTIAVANYGGFGEVTETLPAGFAYVSSPKSDQVEATGQTVSLTLQGDTSIAYTVTASDTAGLHAFSGTLRDSDRNNHDVGGASSVTVRSFDPAHKNVHPR